MFTVGFWLRAQWRNWLLNLQHAARAQERELMSLVKAAEHTRFGRDHDFSSIECVAHFQDRVPLRHYENFWVDYWHDDFPTLKGCTWPGTIPYFALTSGTTTGVTKYIPVSREMLQANSRAVQDLLSYHLLSCPMSRVFGGKILLLGGSTNLTELAPGVYCGDLSGIEANEFPSWAAPYIFPPREIALLTDWEEKIDQIARGSLREDIRAISGTPNWLLMFFDKLSEVRPDRPHRIASYYPNLELLIHGGVDFRPYAKRYADLLEGSHAELREVYPASEAFVAVADRGQNRGMRLLVDNGVFFEFVPLEELDQPDPIRHWLEMVQSGVDYAVVLSTCAGLWGYVLGDTVRFIELDPPRLLVTGRTAYYLSAFGEHLTNAEIEEAVAYAANKIDSDVADFCVTATHPETAHEIGSHCYVVEFRTGLPKTEHVDRFAQLLDQKLKDSNADYESHRRGDYGLLAPAIHPVPPGSLAAWMKKRRMLGGQHKVPRVIKDPELFADLMTFLSSS